MRLILPYSERWWKYFDHGPYALIAIAIIAMMCRRQKTVAAPFQESTLGIVTNSISQ